MGTEQALEVFTDGGCRGNPGPGAWAALLRWGEREKILWGYEPVTTNNRMELAAPIAALEALKRPCRVGITSDSRYLRDGMTQWLPNWKRRGWRTAGGTAVKNRELWERLDDLATRHHVQWHWVRGHSGHLENERVDAILNRVLDKAQGRGAPLCGEGEP